MERGRAPSRRSVHRGLTRPARTEMRGISVGRRGEFLASYSLSRFAPLSLALRWTELAGHLGRDGTFGTFVPDTGGTGRDNTLEVSRNVPVPSPVRRSLY